MHTGHMAIPRRHVLVRGTQLAMAAGAAGLLSGCQLFGTRLEAVCELQTEHRIEELGIELSYYADCDGASPTAWGEGQEKVFRFPNFVVQLLPDTHQAEADLPINGEHGHYRSSDQLPSGEVLDWDDGAHIVYARQLYSEYTNSRTDYADYYAFISFDRAPRPGRSVVTLGWDQVRWGDTPPQDNLREIARSVRLL